MAHRQTKLERPRSRRRRGGRRAAGCPRNNYVARALRGSGLATLLLDLLTPEEDRRRANVFDIPLLAGRLTLATDWATEQSETAALPIGYFGASTGAGAAKSG